LELSILNLIIGPMGALVAVVTILWWVARLVETKFLPAGERFIERHLAQIDKLITSHDNDRAVWSEGLTSMRADVDTVKDDVHQIRARIEHVLGKQDA
jgi:hypothetical protein